MTQQVSNTTIQKQNENNVQTGELNRFLACEEIVDDLIEQGMPKTFAPENFISKIAQTYGISFQEARTCLKLAVKQLEVSEQETKEESQDTMYAQSGYFYPQGYSQTNSIKQNDGMDSLLSLGSYNKMMFGLR